MHLMPNPRYRVPDLERSPVIGRVGPDPSTAEKEGETETALRGLTRIHLFTVIALKDRRQGRLMLLGL